VTLTGWDTSHYDGRLTRDTMSRAKAEGIAFLHAKVGEGLADTEGTYDDTALAGGRDAGIEFLGAYFVPRSLDPAAQVDAWKRELDAGEPWLYDWPGRYAVVDLERWQYDNVQAGKGIDCAHRLRDRLGWQVLLYASRGQYGGTLTGWDGPLINADYRRGPGYPGDGWTSYNGQPAGWAPYSGKTPAMLQYTSSATVAGLTTCDVNAYRGTVEHLRALIGGDMTNLGFSDLDGQYLCAREEAMVGLIPVRMGPEQGRALPFVEAVKRIDTGVAGLLKQLEALSAAFTALAAGGTSLDTAAVLAAVKDAGNTESAAVAALHDQVAALHAQLAAAAQAEASALRS